MIMTVIALLIVASQSIASLHLYWAGMLLVLPNPWPQQKKDGNMSSIRVNVPKFFGTSDPEAYLSWALKVDKVFRIHK